MTLNTWGGRMFQPLMKYIREVAATVDVFCLQEVFSTLTKRKWTKDKSGRCSLFSDISSILPEFRGVFHADSDGYDRNGPVEYDLCWGLATFVRSGIPVLNYGDMFVFGTRNIGFPHFPFPTARNMQFIEVEQRRHRTLVLNMHGLWNGNGKMDTPERIEQSRIVRWLMSQYTGSRKVLCGDFNLNPGTKSLYMLERAGRGMRNLITENGITSTRSPLYQKSGKYADYVLVSPNIRVKSFRVENVEVSDHLPLIVEIE